MSTEAALLLPPGVYANGTEYQSAGRYNDANLVRWYSGFLGPIGGWQQHSPTPVVGAGRAILTWKDVTALPWLAVATESHLYVYDGAGVQTDITPIGFSPGQADATNVAGYGQTTYGFGDTPYGYPGPVINTITDATVWTLDNFGADLVAISPDDNKVYLWTPNPTPVAAAPIGFGAPEGNSLVCTAEGFLFVLGAGGDPRSVQWCDQRNFTIWTPDATNQAGSFPLQTQGRLMQGIRAAQGTLIFTDMDVWLASYVGGELVYGFLQQGEGCGAISRRCAIVSGGQAIWMSLAGWFTYNGVVSPLASDVYDRVFKNLNYNQISKISGWHNSQFGEVWWHYPSEGSVENDSYVTYNYRENTWNVGQIARLSGSEHGVFTSPILVGADGFTYEHETGIAFGGAQPYAETGPFEFSAPIAADVAANPQPGGHVFDADSFVPDESMTGQVELTFKTRFYPEFPEVVTGPIAITTTPVPLRFSGRQMKVRYTFVSVVGARVGICRFRYNLAGER